MIERGNYLTTDDLTTILRIVEFLSSIKDGVSVDAKLYDVNGESLGEVSYGEAGYSYFPAGTPE